MLLSLALLSLLETSQAAALVPRRPEPVASSNDVCKTPVYANLALLANFAPAQTFCEKTYPKTVTVTKGGKVKRHKTTTTALFSTTSKKSTNPATPSTTSKTSPTTTSTNSAKHTTPTTTAAAKCTKGVVECLWSSVLGNGAKTVSLSVQGPTSSSPIAVSACKDTS
jgi:hypothetical protein